MSEKLLKEGAIFQQQFLFSFPGATFPRYRAIDCVRLRKYNAFSFQTYIEMPEQPNNTTRHC